MSIFLRWGLPALVTVVGGTWLAISATASGMQADLDARTAAALADAGHGWAEVVFDGRDAVVSGTVGDTGSVELLVAEVARVRGVRSVRAEVVVAEAASPYPFVVRLEGGAVTLSGGVPDERARTELLARFGGAVDELRVLAGAPPRAAWSAAIEAALAWLPLLDEGEVSLSDLDLTVRGRAGTLDDYDALLRLAASPLPDGVTLVAHEIAPPLVSPFVWRAEFDGRTVTLGGFITDEALLDELRANIREMPAIDTGISAEYAVSASVVLGSGAPDGFADTARLLLRNLLRLESGSAEISDETATLAGAPPDAATAAAIRAELAGAGVDFDLAPPRAAAYDLVLTRDGNDIVVSGFVPDQEALDRLAARPGLDLSGVSLARGAPERFESGIEFGLSLLQLMSDGTFAIHNTTLSVTGRAGTAADFEAIETRLALGAPQGLILSRSDIRPPLAAPFVWSARKSEDGGLAFSGYVPGAAARETLREAAGGPVEDTAGLADGAPEDFVEFATRALGVLALLTAGEIIYDGDAWSMSGAVATPQDGLTAQEAFALAGLGDQGWELTLDVPPQPEEAVAEGYAWRIDKQDDGTITLSGQVPNEDLKKFLAVRAGVSAVDASEVAAGAPPGFVGDALAGLEALSHLTSGAVALEDGQWSLAGVPATAADAELAVAALLTATGEGVGWSKDLAAPVSAVDPGAVTPSAPEAGQQAALDATLPATVAEDVPSPDADARRPFVFAARMELLEPVTLEGAVPADAARRYLGVVAGHVDTENVTLRDDMPADFVTNADFGIRLLRTLHAGALGFDGERWVLEGKVETTGERDAALAALSAVPAPTNWDASISLMTPIDVCWEKVTAFADRNVILFGSGSARIEEESLPALDELAGYLARCPDAAVNVEGHTDSDGDAADNLALSVARAEAVVTALIERGVSFRRLYAIGYGQSLPIADNATSAGKRANRRIVFSFFDDAEAQ